VSPSPATDSPAAAAASSLPAESAGQALKASAASITSGEAIDCGKSIGTWPLRRIPLSVYVHPVGRGVVKYKSQYPGLVTKAFEEWTTATNGTFKFRFVTQLPADITVQFVNATTTGRPGATTNKAVNGELASATIQLAFGQQNTDLDALHLVEHEIGHALGLNHSTRTLGIMAPTLANSENVYISAGDYSDLRRMYGLGEDGKPVLVAHTQFDNYKKVLGAHLASRLKTMPHPIKHPCEVILHLDSTGRMHSYNLTNSNADNMGEINAVLQKSLQYPASDAPFAGKMRFKLKMNPNMTLESAEILK
jgi:hypothetical protein